MTGRIDFSVTILAILLLTIGLIAVYSATSFSGIESSYFERQIYYAIAGFIIMISTNFVPFRFLQRFAYPFYGLTLFLLILVYFIGVKGFGAERWLEFGPLRMQPSELAKLSTILAVAKYLSNRDTSINKLKNFVVVFSLVIIPFFLVFRRLLCAFFQKVDQTRGRRTRDPGDLLFIHPILLCEIDHGFHRVGLALICCASHGHDVATPLPGRVDEFLADLSHLIRCSCHNLGNGNIPRNARGIADDLLGFGHVRLVEQPQATALGQFIDIL